MAFKDWMTKMRAANKVPFGTAYELFAQEAWNAAVDAEREACAKVCADRAKDTPGKLPTPDAYKDEAMMCAATIRSRSNEC